jgi:hypothetical protein
LLLLSVYYADRNKGLIDQQRKIRHRVAVIEVAGLTVDPERSQHRRPQHVAFELGTLDELLRS